MTTRRPPRGRSTAQHLAEIHRMLRRNDRKMAHLARALEQLTLVLRDRLDWRGIRVADQPPPTERPDGPSGL